MKVTRRAVARFLLAFSGLTLAGSSEGLAQAPLGTVTGRVERAPAVAAVGARVRAEGSSASVVTDQQGRFKLVDLPAGRYTLVIEAIGFTPFRTSVVTVEAGGNTVLDVLMLRRLEADAATLTTVSVQARRDQALNARNLDLPRTANDAQPYVILDAAAIRKSGAVDVQDFIRRTLTMEASRITGAQGISLNGVTSTFDLRGLGANHTLVLINGRRISSGNNASLGNVVDQPDLNGIALSSIERIEILPVSAAALYGGSAVGGVINVVLKRDLSGGDVRVSWQNPFESSAPIRRFDASYGKAFRNGTTQVLITGGIAENDVLRYGERPFLHEYELKRQALEGGQTGVFFFTTAAPNIRATTRTQNLTLKPGFGGGALNSNTSHVPIGTRSGGTPQSLGAGLLANAGKQNLQLQGSNQYRGGLAAEMGTDYGTRNVLTSVRHQLTRMAELNLEYNFSQSRSARDLSSFQSITVAANVPTNPFNQSVDVFVASRAAKPTTSSNTAHTVTGGVTLTLPHAWTAVLDHTMSQRRNDYANYSSANVATADLNAALLAGTVNPFVDTDLSPLNLASFFGRMDYSGVAQMQATVARANGRVLRLPSGDLTLAVGAERRAESADDANRVLKFEQFPARNTDIRYLGKGQVALSGYAEMQIPLVSPARQLPLLRQLDVQLAGRVEQYTVETGTASVNVLPAPATAPVIQRNEATYRSVQPTIGVRYRPINDLLLRASYSGAFLPPTYAQLALNPVPSTSLTNVTDPRRGGTTRGVQTLSGGNPDLVPETARSWHAGLVLTPRWVEGLRVTADAYRIRKTNNISALAAQVIVENEAQFGDRVIRGPIVAGDTFSVGPIQTVNTSQMNLLNASTEGLDVAVALQRNWLRGLVDLSLGQTFVGNYLRRTAFNTPEADWVNISGSGPLKYRSTATAAWTGATTTLGWSANYYGRYKVVGPPVSTSTAGLVRQGGPYIDSQVYHSVFVEYRLPRKMSGLGAVVGGLSMQAGVENLLNAIPPYEGNSPNGFTYSTWGSMRLREYRLALSRPF